ncbi:hypothetical protein ACS0TY_015343 [Phlomoides rotata]
MRPRFGLPRIAQAAASLRYKGRQFCWACTFGSCRLPKCCSMSKVSTVLIRVIMRTVDRKSALNMLLLNTVVLVSVGLIILKLNKRRRRTGIPRRTFTIIDIIPAQMKNLSYLCEVSDADCRDQLRMDRATFHKFCFILQSVCGLKSSSRVCVSEKVAIFLSILSHHTKNRCVKFAFKQSGQTVSKHFHAVLNSVLRLHDMFLTRPQPITEDNTDPRERFEGSKSCMDQFGNQTGHDVERVKISRGRRSWSKIEEDALILCLTNAVLDGWKSDNGFNAGFLRELEKSMRKIIPTTDLILSSLHSSKLEEKIENGGVVNVVIKSATPQVKAGGPHLVLLSSCIKHVVSPLT